jgi:hypothetical protein
MLGWRKRLDLTVDLAGQYNGNRGVTEVLWLILLDREVLVTESILILRNAEGGTREILCMYKFTMFHNDISKALKTTSAAALFYVLATHH